MRKYNKCFSDQVQDYKQESQGITVHQISFNYKLSRNKISIRMHFLISFVALVFISLTTLGCLIFPCYQINPKASSSLFHETMSMLNRSGH